MQRLGFGRAAGDAQTAPSSPPRDKPPTDAAATALRWAPAATSSAGYGGDVAGSDPASRHGHTATSIPGGRVLVVGGVCSHGDQGPLRDVHLLDTGTMTWHRGPDYPARTGLCFHTATFVPSGASSATAGGEAEGQVVVLGGVGEAPRSMLSCTSLHTQAPCTWSRQEAMQEPGYPEPRQSHSAVLADRCRIFVCGGVGQHLPSGEAFSDVWIFHLDTLLWLKAEPSGGAFPGRGGHSATMLGRLMLVFGGAAGSSSSSHFNDLWAFDVDHHLWVQVQTDQGVPPLLPRTGHVALAIAQTPPAAPQQSTTGEVDPVKLAEPTANDALVTVASLLVMGGQSVAARGYLALSSKETFHADSWVAELLLPRALAASAALDTCDSGSATATEADDADELVLMPSPTPTHSLGARLRVRWHDAPTTDANATQLSPEKGSPVELRRPTGRSFHRVVHTTGGSAEKADIEMLVLGGIGSGGSVGQDDASWTVTWRLKHNPRHSRSATHEAASEHLIPPSSVAAGGGDIAGGTGAVDSADAFLKKLELEDFFASDSQTASKTIAGGDDPIEPTSEEMPPVPLDRTISASSMEAWPTLSPDHPRPIAAESAGETSAAARTAPPRSAGGGPAGGGASVAGQLEATVQLCAQLRHTVATTQQSEAKYRATVNIREAEIQRLKDAREVDQIGSDQLIEELETRARWGGLPMSIQRATQLYNAPQSIDPQQLPLRDIETLLSSVKTLKLAEVSRWQALVRGGTPAVAGVIHRWLPARQQPPTPDLSFLLYENADAVPIAEVSRLVAEYERLCAAEVQRSTPEQ